MAWETASNKSKPDEDPGKRKPNQVFKKIYGFGNSRSV
jgi:hypothetical protein